MAPKLLLHVGLPKTGTSSIQRFLFDNRESLLKQGFYIPTFLQRHERYPGVHAWTSLLAFEEERVEPLIINFDMHDIDKRRLMRSEKRERIRHAIKEYSDYTWIVSDEILTARMLNHRDLNSLRESFINLFAECKVVFFLRNQLESAVGQWSTDLVNGAVQKEMFLPEDLPEDPKRYLHHQNLLTFWHSCMPDLQFIVKLYDRTNLLKIFADVAGYDATKMTYTYLNENSSLPACCLGLLARYNELHPFFEESGPPSELRRYIPQALRRAFYGHALYKPDTKVSKAYNEYYAASNEWVRSTYFPDLTHLWNGVNNFSAAEQDQLPLTLNHELEAAILNLFEETDSRTNNTEKQSFLKRLTRRFLTGRLIWNQDLEMAISNLLDEHGLRLNNIERRSIRRSLMRRLPLSSGGLMHLQNEMFNRVKATFLRS